MTPEERTALGVALSEQLGGRVVVGSCRRLSAGASRTTWFVDVVVAEDDRVEGDPVGRERTVVLQRERPGGTRSATGTAGEAALLRDAAATGVPVAEVLATDRLPLDDVGLGAWIVLGLVEGETVPRRILRGLDATARSSLLRQCAEALAAVHRIEVTAAHGLDHPDQVATFRGVLDAFGDPQPAFELAFRWLERHRPGHGGPLRVVHGDFRLGNLVVDDSGLRAVLDWELAHLGDPLEDLGWFTARAWRFGSAEPAGGLGGIDEFLDAYRAAGGVGVDEDTLRWWQVLATLKWGVMCIVQAATHQSGASTSVELAAIGRRVTETQEDLLALIDGPSGLTGPGRPPDEPWAPLGGPGGPVVRPGAAELLDAVSGLLDTVRDELDGRTGFHARVAGNVVDQVGRELRLGPELIRRHTERLAGLGVADDAALAAAIRSGHWEDGDRRVLDAVRGAVRDALAVVHPGYEEDGRP